MDINRRRLAQAFAEAFMIYGLIVFVYGFVTIHLTLTWSGDWPVDRSLPWLTLDIFVVASFALSFFGFIVWRYLKFTEKPSGASV